MIDGNIKRCKNIFLYLYGTHDSLSVKLTYEAACPDGTPLEADLAETSLSWCACSLLPKRVEQYLAQGAVRYFLLYARSSASGSMLLMVHSADSMCGWFFEDGCAL